MTLVINKVSEYFKLVDISSLEQVEFENGWNLEDAPKVTTCIATNKTNIYWMLESSCEADYNKELKPYDFKEGLWKKDVAELFIKDSSSNAYQEINIAPSGAYWTGLFSNYRIESEKLLSLNDIIINTEVKPSKWSIQAQIPIKSLKIEFFETSKVNICSILANKHYYSYLDIEASKPDFHRFE